METKTTEKTGTLLPDATHSKIEYAEIGGREIAYRSVGKGETIILCSRFRGNLDSWDPAFLDALARNYRVITFNYTGFATSTGNPPTTILGFARDVKDLAEALKLKKIIVGGWSLGGWVAQIVSTEFPEIVSQTILIGTKPPGKNEHSFEKIFLETAYKANNDLEDETILFFEPASAFSREAAKRSHDRITARKTDIDSRIDESVWNNYKMCNEDFTNDPYHCREKLGKTNIPIIVISGDHEICFPPENWFALNRKLPTTQLIVLPLTGHGPQSQYPELVANYITSFLQNNP